MAFEMVAESVAVIWSSVTKCSSCFPFVIHRQQMESSSAVLISSHSSASTEKIWDRCKTAYKLLV